ncbi:SUKH-4 family immunity protein [Yinghuangia sp. YIM S09857]|uniref:SUKH-4 family immunity protein n=1 Tax=Yinghuangia sp. YIM S09857 TaxID=3436929 RepID=UPI003F5342C9
MVTTEDLKQTFGTTRIRIADPSAVPARVVSESARRVMTEIGLPPGILNTVLINSEVVSFPWLSDILERSGKEVPEHYENLVRLGSFGAGSACFDAVGGEVKLAILARPQVIPPVINSDLYKFVEFLYEIELERRRFERDGDMEAHLRIAAERLRELDPPVMGELSPWPTILELVMDPDAD